MKYIKADLDEIVFESREKDYGAYELRKNYNRRLFRALIFSSLLFIIGTCFPKFFINENSGKNYFAEKVDPIVLEDWPKPEKIKEAIPLPPPVKKKEKPKMATIEIKVPDPKPIEELKDLDKSVKEMDSVETATAGLKTQDGDTVGYDFDDLDSAGSGGEVTEIVIKKKKPKHTDIILVEKDPVPINIKDIRRKIGYPSLAIEGELEGKVVVRVLVGEDGEYQEHVIIASKHKILEKAVSKQLKKIKFTPGIHHGKPVMVWVTIPFSFSLLN